MSQIASNGGQPQKAPKYAPDFIPFESGVIFGKWTVREYVGAGVYRCECVCGVEKNIVSTTLRNGERVACRRCSTGMAYGESGANEVYGDYQRNAHNRGLIFDLPRELARKLFESTCHYCGCVPQSEKRGFLYNGIDRKDNSVGYTSSNCVACCGVCNRIKYVLGYEEFLSHIKRILECRGYHVSNPS